MFVSLYLSSCLKAGERMAKPWLPCTVPSLVHRSGYLIFFFKGYIDLNSFTEISGLFELSEFRSYYSLSMSEKNGSTFPLGPVNGQLDVLHFLAHLAPAWARSSRCFFGRNGCSLLPCRFRHNLTYHFLSN